MKDNEFTIEKATSVFNEIKAMNVNMQLFTELADFASIKADEPMNNDSFLDALILNDYMFSKAQRSMVMLTGHGGEVSFLETLKDSFLLALKNIWSAGGVAKIIFVNGPSETPNDTIINDSEVQRYMNLGALKVKNIRVRTPEEVEHFIVCDNMVRQEKPHAVLNSESSADVIKADVYFSSNAKANMQTNLFDSFWDLATKRGY